MIKHIIAIYPGRFQPFGKHHAAAFKWLQKEFGQANAYIVTSDKVDPPKSPFSFEDKKLEFAKFAYGRTTDPRNYFKVANVLTFSDNKEELNEFIQNQR